MQRRLHPGPPAETGELQGGLLLVLRLLQGEGDGARPELRRRDAQVLRPKNKGAWEGGDTFFACKLQVCLWKYHS